jgi:hypothetical protein
MSFTSAVNVLLQEQRLDLFDVVFLKATCKDLQLMCEANYVPPTDFVYDLYVILYKALLQNITFYIQCDPVYTIIDDSTISIVDRLPLSETASVIYTRYKGLVIGTKNTEKSQLRADLAAIESFGDIMVTFISDSTRVIKSVNDICALMKKHGMNIKISIFLK